MPAIGCVNKLKVIHRWVTCTSPFNTLLLKTLCAQAGLPLGLKSCLQCYMQQPCPALPCPQA